MTRDHASAYGAQLYCMSKSILKASLGDRERMGIVFLLNDFLTFAFPQ